MKFYGNVHATSKTENEKIRWKVEHKNCILLDFLVSMLRTDVMRTPFIWIDILTQAIIYENFQTRKLFGFSQQTVSVTSLLLSHKFFFLSSETKPTHGNLLQSLTQMRIFREKIAREFLFLFLIAKSGKLRWSSSSCCIIFLSQKNYVFHDIYGENPRLDTTTDCDDYDKFRFRIGKCPPFWI